jgi:hypothetical protein
MEIKFISSSIKCDTENNCNNNNNNNNNNNKIIKNSIRLCAGLTAQVPIIGLVPKIINNNDK